MTQFLCLVLMGIAAWMIVDYRARLRAHYRERQEIREGKIQP